MTRSASLDIQVSAALRRLDDLATREPGLAEAAAFYRATIPALHDAQLTVPTFFLNTARAREKLESGRPLLLEEDLPLDIDATTSLFLHLCRILENLAIDGNAPRREKRSFLSRRRYAWSKTEENHTSDSQGTAASRASAAMQIRLAVEHYQLDLTEVWAAVAMGDETRLEQVASQQQLDATLLRVVAETSLRPALRAWSQGLYGAVDLNEWRRGQCPICGNSPRLSEIQGKEGKRRLRCLHCGAGWYYQRLRCAFCGRRDYRSLGFVAVAGQEEKYRLQTCNACRGYVKVVVTYDPIPLPFLSVEDLATYDLDEIAAAHGYTSPPKAKTIS